MPVNCVGSRFNWVQFIVTIHNIGIAVRRGEGGFGWVLITEGATIAKILNIDYVNDPL